ncbi:Las1-domain-containing protein [Punctularia strigosozonata HHB-11173 SS5]|uniref:Las1-domain-containing protein n=1 Tax=Punctularia strigosozonata (strain HHB-11173) TaxID=741275 RepID=UPI0004416F3A|nr:Las1-domain-containing protein [Punctularia strigosozonata HHB-11173 SS5]EIN13451.1 Las1-domain-containing protein [Punctularia strigosozonata HHB-11173 SS5]
MKLPRRVPWSSLAEVDEVCSWIYADENDIDTKIRAIQRLSAWKAITPLPHALESTLAILSVVVEDNSPSTSSRSSLFLRQAYSATLIRLVNGLVDPLQLGAYARSIASIAAQLGLPAWLVELRHAATHEELPSIEVLREGARQSMSWLLHNYFLPILNPSTADQSTPTLHPVQPLLKQYKSLLKITTRDASVALRFQGQITIVLRNIERWLGEAKLAARASSGDVSWDMSRSDQTDPDDSVDYTEKWALESLCDNLLEKGFLVPLSKKKRLLPKDKFEPPASSVALWTPLLNYLQPLHPALPSVLVSRIIDILLRGELADSTDTDAIIPDASYLAMLARWAAWLIERHGNDGEDGSATLREDALVSLAKGFLVQGDVSSNRKA